MDKVIENHLSNNLGSAYKDLAATKEEDNAARTTDIVLFVISIIWH